jgi:hypothetical protein
MSKYTFILTLNRFSNKTIYDHYSKIVPSENIYVRTDDTFFQMQESVSKQTKSFDDLAVVLWSSPESTNRMVYLLNTSELFKGCDYYTENFAIRVNSNEFFNDKLDNGLSVAQLDSILLSKFRKDKINQILYE